MIYLYIFLQSSLLEIPIYHKFSRGLGWRLRKTLLFITFLNSITHPVVFFALMNLKLSYLENIVLAESFAIVAEGLVLSRALSGSLFAPKWFLASFLANLVSWQLAPVLTYLIFRP